MEQEKKEKYQISFSGGKTSAYMTKLLIDNYSDQYDFIVTFANTGLEDPRTLEFIHNCDIHFNFNTVWLESVVDPKKNVGTSFKVVDFNTATRNGSLFESMITKYGIPNKAYPHCTRELKLQPMNAYLRSLGLSPNKVKTAIGIRTDEKRRVSASKDSFNIQYPLIDLFDIDKEDVNLFWEQQKFTLEIDEHNGNCLGCFKKSFKKLFLQLDENPTVVDFHAEMEKIHGQTNNKKGHADRVFFRGNTSAIKLKEMYNQQSIDNIQKQVEEGGCSESCEVFSTE